MSFGSGPSEVGLAVLLVGILLTDRNTVIGSRVITHGPAKNLMIQVPGWVVVWRANWILVGRLGGPMPRP